MKLSQPQSKTKRYYAVRIKTIEQFCAIFMLFTSIAGIGASEKNRQPKKQESIAQIQEKHAFVEHSITTLAKVPRAVVKTILMPYVFDETIKGTEKFIFYKSFPIADNRIDNISYAFWEYSQKAFFNQNKNVTLHDHYQEHGLTEDVMNFTLSDKDKTLRLFLTVATI